MSYVLKSIPEIKKAYMGAIVIIARRYQVSHPSWFLTKNRSTTKKMHTKTKISTTPYSKIQEIKSKFQICWRRIRSFPAWTTAPDKWRLYIIKTQFSKVRQSCMSIFRSNIIRNSWIRKSNLYRIFKNSSCWSKTACSWILCPPPQKAARTTKVWE